MRSVDVIIIGGGVAGLFTLAKCIHRGYSAVLLDKGALGSGQTLKSQGIIHGGTKYALLGKMTEAQRQIAGMPTYWRACLSGRGDVDLSGCRVLSDSHYMWAMPNLPSRITGFFASQFMQSHVQALPDAQRPSALQHPACRGKCYVLDEPVIDVRSLVEVFAKQYAEHIFTHCDIVRAANQPYQKKQNNQNKWQHIDIICNGDQEKSKRQTFRARKIVITAGEGNGEFVPQQLRPLRMVRAHVPKSFGKLFVHVLEASDKPRLTITTYDDSHEANEGLVWYLGGNVAEKGATLSEAETITYAKNELASIFPWLDLSVVNFSTIFVNRAEGLAEGKRPDAPTIVDNGSEIIAWPTKLALAPMLADGVLNRLLMTEYSIDDKS